MDIFEATRNNQVAALKQALLTTYVDVTDQRGSTPLIIAAYYNHLEAAALLLKAGADPTLVDGMGNTSLMGACFKGHVATVRLLLEHGSLIDSQNENQATALTFAATFGHAEIVAMLLSHGANPLIRDRNNKTPIDHCRIQGNDACYELLAAAANERIHQSLNPNQ